MYPGLTHGAADMLAVWGLPEQKKLFLHDMLSGRYAGTMCLSEPHAAPTSARRRPRRSRSTQPVRDQRHQVLDLGGDHDMAENIIHMVLARIEGAPPGTRAVAVHRAEDLGEPGRQPGKANDVATASIEHKLGIKASATAVLNFGENGQCRGMLMGGIAHQGMKQMFRMMNGARIAVGVQGLAVAATRT